MLINEHLKVYVSQILKVAAILGLFRPKTWAQKSQEPQITNKINFGGVEIKYCRNSSRDSYYFYTSITLPNGKTYKNSEVSALMQSPKIVIDITDEIINKFKESVFNAGFLFRNIFMFLELQEITFSILKGRY